jgi:malonyl-CoA O-methyltransferase
MAHPLRAECGQRLIERLDGLRLAPQRILDFGSAPTAAARQLAERFSQATVIALDDDAAHLRHLKRQRGWWSGRYAVRHGNLDALVQAEGPFDLIHAPLVMPRHPGAQTVLMALRQALRPGGLLLMSALGPDSLNGQIGGGDAQRLGSALTRAGFLEPVIDTDWITVTHSDEADLTQCLAEMGVDTNRNDLPPTPCSLTWEIVQATAWAAEEGMPVRTDQGEEASVSISQIQVRRRD